jgi:N-acetylneuraminic acid mutarotase
VVLTGDQILVAGGLRGGDVSTDASYRIALRGHRVVHVPPLAIPVHDTAAARLGRHLFVIGGGNTAEQSTVQEWVGAGWRVVGHLPQARSDLSVAAVGDRIFVLGGYDGTRPAEPDILSSRDGRHWSVVGSLPQAVRYAACAVSHGSIWLFGGEVDGAMQTAIQRVDPNTGRARMVGRLPHALGHAVAVPLEDRVLIAGGRTGPNELTHAMWWFDPATGRVSSAGDLPTPLADAAVVVMGRTGYVVGGEEPALTSRVLRVTYR